MSAAERIESNNDLLTEILLRLPPKSIFRFISVSKRWSHIINDPLFLRSYSNVRRSSGDGRLLALFETKSTIPENPFYQCYIRIEPVGHDFINSSNGLILYRLRHDFGPTKYTVLNPVTKKSVTLPPPPAKSRWFEEHCSLIGRVDGLMCEENTTALAPNYIVVRVWGVGGRFMHIETYSSKTGEWAPSTLAATGYIDAPLFMAPVVVNGVFHWFTDGYNLAVYDPSKYKNHLQLINTPRSFYDCSSFTVTRSPSPDDILLYGSVTWTSSLKFWKLEKKGGDGGSYKRDTTIGRDEWILVHDTCLTSLWRGLRLKECPSYGRDLGLAGVVSREPLVALINWRGTWFLYNFETKTSELVRHRGSGLGGDYCSPFLESSFLSSYAL